MAHSGDIETDVPGTVYLVDSMFQSIYLSREDRNVNSEVLASHSLRNAAHAGRKEILLIPQPSKSPADPLVK